MKELKIFISKYNLWVVLLLAIVTTVCFFYFKDYIYSPYSDISREFYINSQINNGSVLYKDIFNVYAPLGYELNSIITLIFSDKITTFTYIGLVLSILNLTALFLIAKRFTNIAVASSLWILFLSTCVFFPSISNWITPYSYSVLYAMFGFLWAIYFLIKYYDSNEEKFLIGSSLFYGFSISSKYEFTLFILIIVGTMIYKRVKKQTIINSIIAITIFPLISLAILFIQGITFVDLFHSFIYMIKLSNSIYYKIFNYIHGFTPSVNSYVNAIKSVYYDYYYITENIKRYSTHNPVTNIIPNANSFLFIGYLTILINLVMTIKMIVKRQNLKENDIVLYILCLSALLGSIKCIFSVSFETFGTYFFGIITTSIFAFLYSLKHTKIFNRVIVLIILSVSLFYFLDNNQNIKNMEFVNIKTDKGNFKIKKAFYDTTISFLDYLKNQTKDSDRILIMPEGAIINYILDRDSDNKFYYLIPPNVEIFTEKEIINKINETLPEYLAFTNIASYQDFRQQAFTNSFGIEIYYAMQENYKYETTIGKNFKIFIYKVKN